MAINVLIFGATGGVGGFATAYVASKGAHLVLAMRDPSKKVNALKIEQESADSVTRVKADLTDPASVAAAASKVPVHSAFIYQIHGPGGVPKESIQALKDAGVKHVVFLSSWSVFGDIRAIPQSEFIPHAHAKTEIMLEEIFGEGNFTAAKPAWFASNTFRYASQIKSGVVKEMYTDNTADFVAPRDIGEVVGALLLKEQGPLPRTVEICAPQVIGQGEALHIIAKSKGIDLKIEPLTEEEGVQAMIKEGMPPPIAQYLGKIQRLDHDQPGLQFSGSRFEEGQKSVKKYVGRDSLKFSQWIEENAAAFD